MEINKLKAGDTVVVSCQMLGPDTIQVIKEIENDWAIFENGAGKIQLEYCHKYDREAKVKELAEFMAKYWTMFPTLGSSGELAERIFDQFFVKTKILW